MKQINYYASPSHGWIKVKIKDLYDLDILLDVSEYSFITSDLQEAYLEEDCDAGLFVESFGKDKIELIHQEIEEDQANKMIRSCDRLTKEYREALKKYRDLIVREAESFLKYQHSQF